MKRWLKAQLHTHIHGDPHDTFIQYSLEDLIDKAKEKGFDILAITCHERIVEYSKKELDYAKKKNILLIRGIERNIEGKDILIYNPPKNVLKIKKIDELRLLRKKDNVLIGAPHPFYRLKSLGNIISKKSSLFDFFEYSFFYTSIFNPLNRKAEKLAKKHGKSLIGTSDVHYLKNIDMTYSLIYAEKNMDSIFDAIRNDNVKLVTRPISLFGFISHLVRMFIIDKIIKFK